MSESTSTWPVSRVWFVSVVATVLALVVGLLMPTTAAHADEAEDLARWDFTGGAASDVSWHGHDGSVGAGVTFDAAGAVLDGTDEGEITVEHAAGYQPEAAGAAGKWHLSIDGVTPSAVGGSHRTIVGARSADDGWAVYITPQRRIEFWMAQKSGGTKYATASSGVTAAVGSTYDIVVARDGDAISITVTGDGEGTGAGTLSGGYNPVSEGPLRFGNGGNGGDEFFFAGSIAGATIGMEASDEEPPIEEPEPPVTPPDPEYPLEDAVYESAARAVLERAVGPAADQVEFDLVRADDATEQYTISGSAGQIRIEASTPSALTAAAGWYLKYVVHAAVNLGSTQPVVPEVLPAPDEPITKTGHEGYRFALNDTNEGYTDPYLDWDGWQELLDNLALHGVNQVFLSIGTDAVYAELLQQYGYSDAEARAWIPQPAHQPWWVLQNISSEGQEPMSAALLDERADLAARIVERAKELGITPVIPGYFGTVPTDFAERNPDAETVPQGTWSNYQRPSWLDPTTELFASVAEDYYRISGELIGDAGAYKMDPLHEGGKAGDVPVPAAAAGIEKALRAAHPNALWVLLGWQSNPTSTLLSGIEDKSRLLIVDGLSDTVGTLDREARWPGIPYAFGSIYNFGGNTSIGAVTTVWLDRYFAAREKAGSSLSGVAILPEGFYNNPAAYELMSELPWMDAAPDHAQWFREYAEGRYGSDAASEAWAIIAKTAYAMKPIGTHSESHDSLFAAQPSLTTTKARACCAKGEIRYDLAEFATALPALISADSSVVQTAAYEYDLTDVARQVIANLSHTLLPQINAAFQAKDLEAFNELTGTWMDMIEQLDAVIGTSSEFLLGAYVDRAQAQNGAIGEYDLQNLLTTWGTKASFSLHDYANREWQGLVGDFYASRWEQYFETLRTALEEGGSPAAIDWFEVDEAWAQGSHDYPAEPSGDIVEEANKTVDALAHGTATLSLAAPTIRPGGSGTVTATVQNTSPLGALDAVELTLDVPEGLSTRASSETTLHDLGAGETRTVTWDVTVSAEGAGHAVAELMATARVSADGSEDVRTATASVLVGDEPVAPWKMHTTEPDVGFAQVDDQIAIRTTGADFSRNTRRFAAVYQEKTMDDGETVTVHVDLQDSEAGRPWARTGLVVSGDVTQSDSPLALLALTPSNGCALTWNSADSGSLDTHRYASEFVESAWLRITRTGDGIQGACSTDGKAWTVLGTASPAGLAGDAADVGLLASAVNSGGEDRVTAAFSGWELRDGSYGVQVDATGPGVASAGSESALPGALVSLAATPNEGAHLDHWTVEPSDAVISDNAEWTLELSGVTPGALTGTYQAIASSRGTENRGWVMYIAPNGEFQFYLWPDGAANWATYGTGVVAVPGEEYDLRVSLDGAVLRLSVSGAADGERDFDVPLPEPNSGTGPLRFGNGGDTGSEFFYRGSLGGATISNAAGTVAEWAFDGDAVDSSGNGHDGAASPEVEFTAGKAVFAGSNASEIVVDYDLTLQPGRWLRMPEEDVVVTAVFAANAYTVEYDANGGGGQTSATSHEYGVDSPLALNAFIRDGFSFAGWSRAADGDVEFTDGAPVNDLAVDDGAVVTLFAIWKEQPPAVTPTITLDEDVVRAGDRLALSGTGFEPGEGVRLILHSDAVELTELRADDQGHITGTVTIPADVVPGLHQLEARGSVSALSVRAELTVLALADGGGGDVEPDQGDGTDGLATTGAALGIMLPALGLLLLILGAWVFTRRSRLGSDVS